ncbi:MAG: 4-hydroxy-tetrahydrodipicolinate synthase [Bacillota bacterium]
MKKPIFTGSGVAIVTPFKDGKINYKKLGELIDWQIKMKTDCIVICGTTGEASTMPDSEHLEAIGFAVKHVAGRVPVMAGTGSNDTHHAVALSQASKDLGVDAILSVTPYYNKTTQEGLFRHFTYIADRVDIPMIMYNVPSRTNLNLNPDIVCRLSHHKNIYGIKECNIGQVGDILANCASDFAVYSGEDGLVLPMLSYGGLGVISVMANIVPTETHEIVEKFLSGDIAASRETQLKLVALVNALFCETSPIPVKTAMNLMGMDVGECRMPLIEMSDKGTEQLTAELKNLKLI